MTKPRFRIQWDYAEGIVIGYWVWTCNYEATKLVSSFYMEIKNDRLQFRAC